MVCLFNTFSNNVVGYCNYHNCGITKRQMDCKNCVGKQCHHFIKNEKHDHWRQVEVKKQRRKNRKNAINDYVNKIYKG